MLPALRRSGFQQDKLRPGSVICLGEVLIVEGFSGNAHRWLFCENFIDMDEKRKIYCEFGVPVSTDTVVNDLTVKMCAKKV